jgi:hypothetical protein
MFDLHHARWGAHYRWWGCGRRGRGHRDSRCRAVTVNCGPPGPPNAVRDILREVAGADEWVPEETLAALELDRDSVVARVVQATRPVSLKVNSILTQILQLPITFIQLNLLIRVIKILLLTPFEIATSWPHTRSTSVVSFNVAGIFDFLLSCGQNSVISSRIHPRNRYLITSYH